ncbi:BTAD domain-containing putative transcriptional regulator [Phycicoccus sp. 3266]|uniref:BTAD domain-containing putative transcriptional regulator n=1 Tax=Phycicoccus sp. 3266 TaxID=2817751 RepID=UPI002855623D|nr:BTAD domain-containing putative transcriptional regulator [Phycicoccus sp. 3266]MDR6863283.1 DNA-binding SARP family transcriptional activator [Phycicoccus sp. 3266]
MRVGVLGAAQAQVGDEPVDLGTRKQRALVAALAMNAGRPVSVDAIVDLLWPQDPPRGVTGTLQAYVAGLRRALEPDRPARAPSTVLVTVAPGYALRVAEDDLDATRFDRVVSRTHRRLGRHTGLHEPSGLTREELQSVVADLDEALALWRGTPYLELEDAPAAVAERARLEELRVVALEDRAVAALELGQHATVAGELEALTTAHPLRERLWGLRALALTRSGRQAEALDALREVREVLGDELGLEPGQELRDLQGAVLRQDPVLDWTPVPEAPAIEPTTRIEGEGAAAARREAAASPAAETSPPAPRIRGTVPSLPDWPLVGRSEQLAELVGALDRAESGTPTLAALVGEPGIGKSRLAAELAAVAVSRGVTVLLGRCSQDDGAPPLWSWQQVLRGLGRDLPEEDGDDDGGARFRTWEAIAADVLDAAASRTLLVILDDLHWADVASLRVLRLLGETMHDARLMVLGTWRSHPEPADALLDAVETFARRHAVRLELRGLSADDASRVVEAVSHRSPSTAEAAALRGRTDGNPFFLVEYGRLAREGGDLSALLSEPHAPAAVHDVLARRLQRIPEETLSVLRWAAVVGRSFDLGRLEAASGLDEDTLLDRLDPALDAGLVREDGIGRFLFGHALVRDTIYAAIPATRRARAHARLAQAMQGMPGRETELARHWLAAGPAHAARAWLAAVGAAALARRLHAYEEAAGLLRSALDTLPLDPDSTPRERYDVLTDLAEAQRWSGDWTGLIATTEELIAVAEELDDVQLLARAATTTAVGALWQSGPHGSVNEGVVRALREVLQQLPATDDPVRCRVMLSLALEIYYGSTFEERRALCDEGLAMARRLGDEALLLDACQLAFTALWRPSTAPERRELMTEGMELAHRLGNERAYVVTTTLRAVVAAELGLPEEMWEHAAVARDGAQRLRLPYGLIVLDSLTLPWLAMAGRFEECEELMADIVRLDQQMTLSQTEDATTGAFITLRLWQGRSAEVAPTLEQFAEVSPLPVTSTVLLFWLRGGERERAVSCWRQHPVDLDGDDWFSMLNWCAAAEVGLWLDDHALASQAYERLAPYAGRSACAGSGNAIGPVDLFLAQAAAAVGERELAARHADAAQELLDAWQLPLAAEWFRAQRERFTF